MLNILYSVLKTLTLCLTVFGVGSAGFAPLNGAETLTGKVTPPGDSSKYIRLEAADGGIDVYRPGREKGGYRYGPSMILNADGSVDYFSAAVGTCGEWDFISYFRLYDEGTTRTKETVALKPTMGTEDAFSTCDPGAVAFGGWYYIGYTSTMDSRGTDNNVYVARSRSPGGPYEKWDGSGWGTEPRPLIEYTGDPDAFGAGEPSFVVMGDTLYIYYSLLDENGVTTRVATADATDENWPATVTDRGTCIPDKRTGDSADVKYADEYGRFIAVFTSERFSDDSYVSVWESFDGLSFRPAGIVRTDTAKKLHNCGISGRADGHICAGDPVYLSYAYGSDWGIWATRLHRVTLSLSDEPETDPSAEQNRDVPVVRKKERAIPEVITIAAKDPVLDVKTLGIITVYAFDSDTFLTPVLSGVKYSGYDTSLIRIDGNCVVALGSGSTRVTAEWNGYTCDFIVNAKKN